jgi:hypothetical protein
MILLVLTVSPSAKTPTRAADIGSSTINAGLEVAGITEGRSSKAVTVQRIGCQHKKTS